MKSQPTKLTQANERDLWGCEQLNRLSYSYSVLNCTTFILNLICPLNKQLAPHARSPLIHQRSIYNKYILTQSPNKFVIFAQISQSRGSRYKDGNSFFQIQRRNN